MTTPLDEERAAYESLLATSPQRSVFAEPWWLDAAVGESAWRPNVLRDGSGAARAAWPLPTRATRIGLVAAGAPYTPFVGPQLSVSGAAAELTTDIDALDELGAQLARTYAHVEAACMPELDYWTPLHWHGFTQTTRTTWRLDASTPAASTRDLMRKKTRGALNAAERDGLQVDEGSVEDLLTACAATFGRQGMDAVPARDALERLTRAALERGRGAVLRVRTGDGQLASAGFTVWDDRWTYNLANGRLDVPGAVGAPTLLLHASIQAALERGTGFDFEGSMLRPVERFVRGFGGRPHAYAVVRRSDPAWERIVLRRRWLKRLLRR